MPDHSLNKTKREGLENSIDDEVDPELKIQGEITSYMHAQIFAEINLFGKKEQPKKRLKTMIQKNKTKIVHISHL